MIMAGYHARYKVNNNHIACSAGSLVWGKSFVV